MSEQDRTFYGMSLENVAQVHDLIGRLFRVAEPGAVYSEPVVAGDRTVVVTSELSMTVGAGVGFGHSAATGGETAAPGGSGEPAPPPAATAGGPSAKDETGGGGGGGGFSFGRPVAAVVIEPHGVRVEPIVDVTKLGIALFTTLGAMFFAWTALRRTTNQLAVRQISVDARAAEKIKRELDRENKRAAKQAAKVAAKEAKAAAKAAAKDSARQARKEAKQLAGKAASESATKAADKAAKEAAKLAIKDTVQELARNAARQVT
jgi:uncharacterized spore protein YtfJ